MDTLEPFSGLECHVRATSKPADTKIRMWPILRFDFLFDVYLLVFYVCVFACLWFVFCAFSGHVTREDMTEFGRFMNSTFDEGKLNKLMDQMDLDKDGVVSIEEFVVYFATVRFFGIFLVL